MTSWKLRIGLVALATLEIARGFGALLSNSDEKIAALLASRGESY